MEYFVDEMPNSCEECPMYRSGKLKLQRKGRYIEAEQCVFGQYKYRTIDDEIDTCPLQSLSDHDNQVRKEVCEKIIKFAYDTFKEFGCFDETDLEHILDQIENENF